MQSDTPGADSCPVGFATTALVLWSKARMHRTYGRSYTCSTTRTRVARTRVLVAVLIHVIGEDEAEDDGRRRGEGAARVNTIHNTVQRCTCLDVCPAVGIWSRHFHMNHARRFAEVGRNINVRLMAMIKERLS